MLLWGRQHKITETLVLSEAALYSQNQGWSTLLPKSGLDWNTLLPKSGLVEGGRARRQWEDGKKFVH